MADLLFVLHCAPADADLMIDMIRSITSVPIHHREEAVLGRDFSDAGATEQVSGVLRRVAFEFIVEESMIPALIAAVGAARRKHPVRWHSLPIVDRGRIA